MTHPSWVVLHSMAHSFIELCKPLCHNKDVTHEVVFNFIQKFCQIVTAIACIKKKKTLSKLVNFCNFNIEHGLLGFVLETSPWTILHSWVDQLKLTVIKSRHQLRVMLHLRDIVDILKVPNQSLEIICMSLVNHFDVWVPHKQKKKKKKKPSWESSIMSGFWKTK